MRIGVTDARGRPAKAGRGLAAWLRRAAPARARGDIVIALVSDARMRDLNCTYRGERHATDVLSFPSLESGGFLGEIAIATGVARRQARDQGHSPAVELRILALHGLLHLLGYDHERDRGRMRRLEQRLLHRTGLRGGLIERARPSTLREAQGRPEQSRRTTGSGRAFSISARGELVEPRVRR